MMMSRLWGDKDKARPATVDCGEPNVVREYDSLIQKKNNFDLSHLHRYSVYKLRKHYWRKW